MIPAIEPDGWELGVQAAVERVLAQGVHWLGMSDNPTLALLAEALEVYERAKQVATIRDQLESIKTIQSLLSQLGFDPTARARLGLAEVKAMSTLEALRASSKTQMVDTADSGRTAKGRRGAGSDVPRGVLPGN